MGQMAHTLKDALTQNDRNNMKHNYNYSIVETPSTTFENPPRSRHSRAAAQNFTRTSSLGWALRLWPAAAFLWLCLLLVASSELRAQTGLTPYVMHNPDTSHADQEPPKGGGNGWVPVGAGGITLQPHEIVALAVRNVYNADRNKTCKVMLGDRNNGDGQFYKDNIGKTSPAGWDSNGDRTEATLKDELVDSRDIVIIEFKPQPAWERINLENKTDIPLTFPVEVETKCQWNQVYFNALKSKCSFGAAGAMVTNQAVKQVMVFPRTISVDPTVPPTLSAPPDSGNWSATPVYIDPDGTNRPLGGVLYKTDGAGLSPGEECQFSFLMQGPTADLQYAMYAYDDVAQEFQEYNLDLHPKLSIATINNAVGLQFDSVLGLDYILQNSIDLQTWQPLHTFTGTGGTINSSSPRNGPIGFFRLQCVPSPITPPALSTIDAEAWSTFLVLTFSEPVSSVTATNLPDYFVGNNLGPVPILSVSQLWDRAVRLTLATPMTPGGIYFLGVQGVGDLNGELMTPTTVQFIAATLQTPCPGGTLLARQAYSECNTDGFWHVVEDDWYRCPDGTTRKFRVADTKTTQPCGPSQTAPSAAGLLYPTAADVASTCQSPVLIGQVQVRECVGGLWSLSTYLKYRCLDGTIYLSGPIQNVPMNPPTPCDQLPPPMPAP
jgi:hypothetical protein